MFKLSHLVSLSAALTILNGSAYAATMQECIEGKAAGISEENAVAMAPTFLEECCEGDLSEDPLCNIDATLDEFAQGLEEGLAGLAEGLEDTLEGLEGALGGLASIADCMGDAGLNDGCDCTEIIDEVVGGDMAAFLGEEMVGAMTDCCPEGTSTEDFNTCFAEKEAMMDDGEDGATPTTLPAEGDATPTTLPAEGDEGDATPTTLPAEGDEGDATPTTLPADAEADTADEVAAASDSAGTGAFVSALTSVGIMSVAAFTL